MTDSTDVRGALEEILPPFARAAVVGPSETPEPLHRAEAPILSGRVAPKRRRDFEAGRTAARRALADLGVDPASPVLQGAHREPLWPTGITGSITHAHGWAIAAVAPSTAVGGLGIDLEHRDAWFPGLANEVAFGAELDHLRSLGPEEQRAATVALFAAKESVYKAFFPRVGRYFGFEAASVRPVGDGLEATLAEGLDPSWDPDRPIPIGLRWIDDLALTAVAVEGDH